MHAEVAERGLGYAWDRDHCPAVNAGPEKEVGHSRAGRAPHAARRAPARRLRRVSQTTTRATCSASGTSSTRARPRPRRRRRARGTRSGRRSTQASRRCGRRRRLGGRRRRPRARSSPPAIPEPMYALGHQLGRTAHDGGTVLAPALGSLRRCAARRRRGGERLHARVRHGRPGSRVHRARGGRPRDRRRRRVAVDAAARALARALRLAALLVLAVALARSSACGRRSGRAERARPPRRPRRAEPLPAADRPALRDPALVHRLAPAEHDPEAARHARPVADGRDQDGRRRHAARHRARTRRRVPARPQQRARRVRSARLRPPDAGDERPLERVQRLQQGRLVTRRRATRLPPSGGRSRASRSSPEVALRPS